MTGSIFIVTRGEVDFSKLDCKFSLNMEEVCSDLVSLLLNELSFDWSGFVRRLLVKLDDGPSLLLKPDDRPSLLDKLDDVVKRLVKFDDSPGVPDKEKFDFVCPSNVLCKAEDVIFPPICEEFWSSLLLPDVVTEDGFSIFTNPAVRPKPEKRGISLL